MNQSTMKWRAPEDFARHSTNSLFRWLALYVLLLFGQWAVTQHEPKNLTVFLIMLGTASLMNWNCVPRYLLGQKSLHHTNDKGRIERDWEEVESYCIYLMPQICNLKVIEFKCVYNYKRKQLPPFIFDPRETDETQLRAFLSRKLPDKEIVIEETPREYSHPGAVLISWRKSAAEFRADFNEYVKPLFSWLTGIALVGMFIFAPLVIAWNSSDLLSAVSQVCLIIALCAAYAAFSWWRRPRFSLCEHGAMSSTPEKAVRFLWSSVSYYSVLPHQVQPYLRKIFFVFKDGDYRFGNVFLIVPEFTLDTRETDEARVLALLREKLPDKFRED